MHKYYLNLRKKEKINIFVFPESFKKASNAFKKWPTIVKQDEMIIDLRDEEEKRNVRESTIRNSLINEPEMWEELPIIISSQVVH